MCWHENNALLSLAEYFNEIKSIASQSLKCMRISHYTSFSWDLIMVPTVYCYRSYYTFCWGIYMLFLEHYRWFRQGESYQGISVSVTDHTLTDAERFPCCLVKVISIMEFKAITSNLVSFNRRVWKKPQSPPVRGTNLKKVIKVINISASGYQFVIHFAFSFIVSNYGSQSAYTATPKLGEDRTFSPWFKTMVFS